MNIKDLECELNATIQDVLRAIDKNTKGTVFIIDQTGRLCGILTDGDIRRALLDGCGMNAPIQSILKKDYVYATIDEDRETVLSKFNSRISILPIVDADMKIIDFTELHQDERVSLALPQLNKNEYKYLMNAFLTTWISSAGEYIPRFEESFSSYCGVKYGVAVSNGTVALHLALIALGIGSGDEVIVPDLTFAATINAVIYTGAKPVIVDIEEDGWCIDPKRMEEAINEKTRAVIPVHLYGQPCNMEEICRIAHDHNLFVVEDCAEAHGAEYNGNKVGSFSDVACFSFYGNKVITTGEGGMCLTNDETLYNRLKLFRDHGMSKERRYYHEVIGYNYRMTNMQAAIGTAQTEHIDEMLAWRGKLEETYRNVFKASTHIELQRCNLPKRKKITWLVSALVDAEKRDFVMNALSQNGIDIRPFFYPLSSMDIYKDYVFKKCSVSHDVSARGINLPTTYMMTGEKVARIYEIMAETVEKTSL